MYDAFVNRLEQPRERRGRVSTSVSCRESRPAAASASASCVGKLGAELLLDGARISRHRRARRVHLPRPRRDVDAHGALEAVRFPLDHVAVLRARSHEAVGVALVAALLAPAEARDVAGDLGMLGRELERRRDDFDRTRRRVAGERDRRKVGLFMRTEAACASVAAMISGVGSAPFAPFAASAAAGVAGLAPAAVGAELSPRQNAKTAMPITATAITARSSGLGPDRDWAGTTGVVV